MFYRALAREILTQTRDAARRIERRFSSIRTSDDFQNTDEGLDRFDAICKNHIPLLITTLNTMIDEAPVRPPARPPAAQPGGGAVDPPRQMPPLWVSSIQSKSMSVLKRGFAVLTTEFLSSARAADLQRKGYAGCTVGIKLRFDDFRITTRDVTLTMPTSDAATIRRAGGECLRRITLEQKIRLLGVRVGTLSSKSALQEANIPAQGELALTYADDGP